MSDRRTVALEVTLDGRQAESETTCAWTGPYILAVCTVLPGLGLATELHSAFVGHAGVPTCATHLMLGPVGHAPFIIVAEHEHANLEPTIKARECVYEHAGVLLENLKSLNYELGIDLSDDAFEELERIER
jgi:hypothetical protein